MSKSTPKLPDPIRWLVNGSAKLEETCCVSYAVLSLDSTSDNDVALFTVDQVRAYGSSLLRAALEGVEEPTDADLERMAIQSGLDEELWFGQYTPKGYEGSLPKLRRFAQAARGFASPIASDTLRDADDKWAMLVRTGHLSQEVADSARAVASAIAPLGGKEGSHG